MSSEVENYIAQNCSWSKLPTNIKQLLGNSQKEYDKQIIHYCIKTQQRYSSNLVRNIIKDQKTYYEELVAHSQAHLMMFPYHLSDVVVRGLRLTPFQYYIAILTDIMTSEKSYDSLPNFTAADCLRLLGIGRNQYIDIMNQCRSTRKLFRRKNVRELLPALPVDINIEAWWTINVGCIIEEDMKNSVKEDEKSLIDMLIDSGPQKAGSLDKECVHGLYSKGLVFLDVPINDSDCLSVPPLEGFVMNRVLGDYLEDLMYKIFVSIDEHTPVIELAKILQIDISLVKVAVSLFCRLGFACRKPSGERDFELHESWSSYSESRPKKSSPTTEDLLLLELESALSESIYEEGALTTPAGESAKTPVDESMAILGLSANGGQNKRIAFLYDSTLTAFLMMGNLSPGLKNHAVTMFEVGKLLDEGLSSLITELEKIQRSDSEGEAQRYFEHALTLKTTIHFLRHNPDLITLGCDLPPALDLIRWESLSNLDPATTARLLNKNYQYLVSMAPLSYEIPAVEGAMPPHFGPPIPEVNSTWFKLYIYSLTGSGPPSLLLPKGERLRRLPACFTGYEKVLVTPWGHDPTVVPLVSVFFTVNEALMHSPVFIQGYGWYHDVCIQHVPIPVDDTCVWANHPALKSLRSHLDLRHSFGYLKFVAFPSQVRGGAVPLGASEIKTGVPLTFPSDVMISKIPQVVSFDDVSSLSISDAEAGGGDGDVTPRKELSISTSGGSMLGGFYPPLSEWILLECNFGLPLFDAQLNEEISRRIISHSLFKAESIEAFVKSSKELVRNLNQFIEENQAMQNPARMGERRSPSDSCSSLPLPTSSLLFDKGRLLHCGTS